MRHRCDTAKVPNQVAVYARLDRRHVAGQCFRLLLRAARNFKPDGLPAIVRHAAQWVVDTIDGFALHEEL